jgi:uncharacterized membrane protein YfcA
MHLSTVLLFLAVGAAGGFTAGLFGVGGGLVIVPTLYFLWRHDPVLGPDVMHHAVATSLACIVISSVTSTWTHWRAGRFAPDMLVALGLSVSLGSVLAVWASSHAPTQWLKLGFGLFALATCVSLLRSGEVPARSQPLRKPELWGAGSLIGHVSTLLGVSGGALVVPYLLFRGVDMRRAVVVSSQVAIPVSVIGSVGMALTGPDKAWTWGYVHWPAWLAIGSVSIYFANRGAHISQTLDKRRLKRLFAGFLALVSLHMLSG